MTEPEGQMPSPVGPYEILGELGRGPTGVVYRARAQAEGSLVALKVLPDELTDDPDYCERFLDEARAAARLNHDHIVRIFEVGEAGGHVYVAMECVEGRSLADFLKQHGRLDVRQAFDLVFQVGLALIEAHKQGLFHRDINPQNIMSDKEGHVKVVDFGLPKPPHATTDKTELGVRVSKPIYISPEEARGEAPDACSDIYSLGATLFEMLAGRPAFEAASPQAFLYDLETWPFPDVTKFRPDVPPAAARVLMKMMAPDPANRYQSARELCHDIDVLLHRARVARQDLAANVQHSRAGQPLDAETIREIIASPTSSTASRSSGPSPARRNVPWWVWAALAVALGAGALALALMR